MVVVGGIVPVEGTSDGGSSWNEETGGCVRCERWEVLRPACCVLRFAPRRAAPNHTAGWGMVLSACLSEM